jgi:hypothetical protein
LGCLWARRVWSGRLGPGIILVVFLGHLFGARNGHMDSAEMHKNKWFGSYLCAKGGSQNRCMRAPLFRKHAFSPLFLRILAGTFCFKMNSLVPNWGFHSVFLVFCSVPFVGSFWVLLTGWSAGWLALAGWLAGPGWLAVGPEFCGVPCSQKCCFQSRSMVGIEFCGVPCSQTCCFQSRFMVGIEFCGVPCPHKCCFQSRFMVGIEFCVVPCSHKCCFQSRLRWGSNSACFRVLQKVVFNRGLW